VKIGKSRLVASHGPPDLPAGLYHMREGENTERVEEEKEKEGGRLMFPNAAYKVRREAGVREG